MATAQPQSASAPEFRSDIEAAAFPTREYIGAMALEMARLAGMREQVAGVAGHPAA